MALGQPAMHVDDVIMMWSSEVFERPLDLNDTAFKTSIDLSIEV